MPVEIVEQAVDRSLADRVGTAPPAGTVVLDWLGQAGFLVRTERWRVLIDPYLSDTLAAKYRGTATPHERLMPPPVTVDELGPVDLVLVTHQHTDHMDPGTLAPLAQRHAGLRFVVPRATRDEALRRIGVPEARLILLDAGDTSAPLPGLTITAIRAAHETLERDAAGHHRFLGYGLTVKSKKGTTLTIVHSGDTVPFAGQDEEIIRLRPDLLLLPVNGRSAALAAHGIAGNLTLDEAVELTRRTRVPCMIAHHHGLFAFNTVPLPTIEAKAAMPTLPIRLLPARTGLEVRISST